MTRHRDPDMDLPNMLYFGSLSLLKFNNSCSGTRKHLIYHLWLSGARAR